MIDNGIPMMARSILTIGFFLLFLILWLLLTIHGVLFQLRSFIGLSTIIQQMQKPICAKVTKIMQKAFILSFFLLR